jgi:hypothetical protein
MGNLANHKLLALNNLANRSRQYISIQDQIHHLAD